MRAATSLSGRPFCGNGSSNRGAISAEDSAVDTGSAPSRVRTKYRDARSTNGSAASRSMSCSSRSRIGGRMLKKAEVMPEGGQGGTGPDTAGDRHSKCGSRSAAEWNVENAPATNGLDGEIALHAVNRDRLIHAHAQQSAFGLGRERREKAERAMRREDEARTLEAQAASSDAFVQGAQCTVRIERQHDDVRLHEAHRPAESQGERRNLRGSSRELVAQFVNRRVGWNRPDAR